MNKQKLLITLIAVGLVALGGYGVPSATGKEKKQTPAAQEAAGQKKAETIDATAKLSDNHPAFEEGTSCNDCHEVKLDAKTTATQAWQYGDYLSWKAGEGIMPKDKLWEHIVKVIGGSKAKRTYILATVLNNRPYAITIEYALDPVKKVMYAFSEKGTSKLNHIKANPYVALGWHEEFKNDFTKLLCVSLNGRAELFDGSTREFDEGLSVYPYEYGANMRKIPLDKFKAIMKQAMIMSRITLDEVTVTDTSLKDAGFRTSQRWMRK
jgi:nitroimidazol reductase NimA-like FMN-containing flavoprotein (pyridoxamine 5'-phosphate oxidase superfamily)